MRVAMITGSYPPQPCGVGDYTARLVLELQAAGVEVDVFTTALENGPRERPLYRETSDWRVLTWWRESRRLTDNAYDIVHIQYPARFYGYRPDLAFLSLVVRRRVPGVPIVVTLHEFWITHVLRKLTVAAIAQPASRVFVSAESERSDLLRWFPWMAGRIRILRLGLTIDPVAVTEEGRERIRRTFGVIGGGELVTYFGLLHPNKGIDTVLHTFALIQRDRPAARLLMIAAFAPESVQYHAELKRKTAELGIASAVIWAGFLPADQAASALASSDVAFLPFQDGVSFRRLSFLTAMAHGVPVLTTTGHASEEMALRHGVEAMLLPAGSPASMFAGRLREVLDSEALRRTLGEAGRRWSGGFSWPAITDETLKAYREVIQR